ncbi:MAG TPA: toll/interleukin-1 receptor domain-containing protein [Chthoniobacterales bacterium]|jgi:hypothetical protein
MYDVFISYRWVDPEMSWVRDHLVPALQAAGLRTLLDVEDFVPGRDLILEMDRAGRESRRVLCVLSPAYFEGDRMVSFESLTARRMNPTGSESRLIPLLIHPTKLPEWIRGLVPIDWTNDCIRVREWNKLLRILGARRKTEPPRILTESKLPQSSFEKNLVPVGKTKLNAASVITTGRFEASATSENRGNLLKYRLFEQQRELRYCDVVQLWKRDHEFVDFYISIFKRCGFQSYVWETPPVSSNTMDRLFEFVLCNIPSASRTPDRETYACYFDTTTSYEGIVAFNNLGGDAILVVPSPFRIDANYADLAAFFREAPITQQRALWSELARQIESILSDEPMWISVASGGISWLHLRLDSAPKYYRYVPYASS